MPTPRYTPNTLEPPAFQLRFTWTGWPSAGSQFPPVDSLPRESRLTAAWESEGIRPLEYDLKTDRITLAVSTRPSVAPSSIARALKGRLHHALRESDLSASFARNFSLVSVGDSTREVVERYVRSQVDRADLADPAFAAALREHTVSRSDVDLSRPASTSSGRYLYNLHLVLVVRDRFRITDDHRLHRLRCATLRIADDKNYRLSTAAVMPDHLHLALGAPPDVPPAEVATSFMNNLAYMVGPRALWKPSYYAGTFGEYDMDALR